MKESARIAKYVARQSRLTMALALILANAPVSSEIYKWTDEQGRIHYSDKPVSSAAVEVVKTKINSYEAVSYDTLPTFYKAPVRPHSATVIMYSTSWCAYCKVARAYFAEKNIAFDEYNIEDDKQARQEYDALGGMGVPVILVGSKRMNGFTVAGFEAIYP